MSACMHYSARITDRNDTFGYTTYTCEACGQSWVEDDAD